MAWDEEALSYAPTGQRCERFVPDGCLRPGETLSVGGQQWLALAAPGHDPHSLVLFNADSGVVITADALWERGFGVVFPELDGEAAFDEVAATLDLIASLGARVAIPGHGAAFNDIPAALVQARQRLAAFRADPRAPCTPCAEGPDQVPRAGGGQPAIAGAADLADARRACTSACGSAWARRAAA